MEISERGSAGPATVAVVGGIHGDEPAGERIVERLAEELPAPGAGGGEGAIRLIVANEPALEAGTRYTDTDLNRAFPGDADSDAYERALAVRLTDALEGADAVLAIHTSHSAPPPFAIYSHLTDSVRRTVTGMPVEYVLDSSGLRGTTLDSVVDDAVSLEAGRQGSEDAVEFGYEAARGFLRAHGALAGQPTFSETTIVEGGEEVPKGGGEPTVNYRNFEEIPAGEVFASDDVYTHRVDEPGIVPVLASERGYDDIFGIYGRIVGTVSPPGGAEGASEE
ncbi:AstE domain protein [Natronomonas moolapensis 8.8.11]|uniref:AstE domain protein n=1 Tax=Natronomonas moolapensis (strain DSM 18674 / CECT 7526 / JCM 14361 / 8.8.11) TaxID=268739 RepID=M1XLD4_NATM8|nr:succinylglutamate desuccinylase/aspartoacylase family protein [Natronomonas moolapensis]CCQ37516.1 AstE domain protein [Natronomonas moolapensis 8.8.11]